MEYWVIKMTVRREGLDSVEALCLCGTLDEMLEAISEKNCLTNNCVVKATIEFFETKEDANTSYFNLLGNAD